MKLTPISRSLRNVASAALRSEGRSPDAGAGDPHGAITETVDRDISDPELGGGAGVD